MAAEVVDAPLGAGVALVVSRDAARSVDAHEPRGAALVAGFVVARLAVNQNDARHAAAGARQRGAREQGGGGEMR